MSDRWRDRHVGLLQLALIVAGVAAFYAILWYLGQLIVFLRGPLVRP